MKNTSISKKLLVMGLASVIIPVIIISFFSIYKSTVVITEQATLNLNALASNLSKTLDIVMNGHLNKIMDISFSNSIIAAAERVYREGAITSAAEIKAAQKELTKIKKAVEEDVSSITLVKKKDGIVFTSSDDGKYAGLDLSSRDYIKIAFEGKPAVGAVVASKATGKLICTVAYPIYSADGKDVTGAVVMALWLGHVSNLVESVAVGRTGYAYIVDEGGTYLTHPQKENILAVSIGKTKGMDPLAAAMKAERSGWAQYEVKGVRKTAAFAPVHLTGWRVVAALPRSELYAAAWSTGIVILVITAVMLFLAAIFFALLARNITRPLSVAVEAADRLGKGDTAMDITVASDDEAGKVLRALQRTMGLMKQVALTADRVAAGDLTVKIAPLSESDVMGKALAAMVENTRKQIGNLQEAVNVLSSSASEIMASVAQVSTSTMETSTAVSETTTTVEEIKQTADAAAQKAQHVSELGRKTSEISRAGLQSIEETLEGMNQIQKQMESIADTVIKLSEQSQTIGEIIATVGDIAEQSNLLAVNAAIEAAKAGEQGRGFGVVAQEMKGLADQSKQATAQIRNILNDIQKAIGSAVMSTEKGGKAVDEGVKLSTRTSEAIELLAESIAEAADASLQITASSRQQLIGMEQVAQAMENIRSASIQTASGMKQVDITVQELNGLGQRLRELLQFYKIAS